MQKTTEKFSARKILAIFMAILLLISAFATVPSFSLNTSAASEVTSIGLAEYGIKAFNDGWVYNYGSKGEKNSAGKRMSDCSGLLYAYFTDNGVSGAPRTVTQQANSAVQSGSIYNMPRVHGLIITITNYDHVGIYIGNNQSVDNSDYTYNMRWTDVITNGSANRGWIQWHMMAGGNLKYPTNGWYAFNGKMYHYTDRQYDINTTKSYNGTTYSIGSDGVVCDSSGSPIAVNNSMPNSGFSSAAAIPGFGADSPKPDGTEATVTGSGVRVRGESNTSSAIKGTLNAGNKVYIQETVTGESISSGGQTSATWYKIATPGGIEGYICSLFVSVDSETTPTPTPPANVSKPNMIYSNGYVDIDCGTDGATIYYTKDGTIPSESSSIYTGPILHTGTKTTYKAIAYLSGKSSDVTSFSVMSNNIVFNDVCSSVWHFSAIDEAVSKGIFNGKGNNVFAPDDSITRAEFVKSLANLADADLSSYTKPSFNDVKEGDWHAKVIAWAEDNEIVKGKGGGNFGPNDKITREQICVIMANFGSLSPSNSNKFSDDSQISGWAKDAVYACRDKGIISGKGGNRFAPSDNATRAEAAKITVNFVNCL